MPLLVHCPTGCVIRVPRARAGTMVRCTECKTIIQLRVLTSAEIAATGDVEIRATLASVLSSERSETPVANRGISSSPAGSSTPPPVPTVHEAHQRMRQLPVEIPDPTSESPRAGTDAQHELEPDKHEPIELPILRPARLRFNRAERQRTRWGKGTRSAKVATAARRRGLADEGEDGDGVDAIQIDEDVSGFRSDDELRFLTQFYAACIGFMGLVLIVPSFLAWGGWAALPVEPMGSRWIFIMIYLGALHLMYAVFLFQVPDRSALWAISLFLLVVGCVHGVFTAGTWLDAGSGPVSRFLQLPASETAAVTLWCFLHLCFSALLCYLCGRQALKWKQSLLEKSPPTAN